MSEHLHVACPACAAINRVPATRLEAGGKCGKCRAALFTGTPVDLGERSFSAHTRSSDIPALVDFWAPWCAPCKAMAPLLEQAATRLEPRVRICKLNTEVAPGIASLFAIRAIPTLVLFKNGRDSGRLSGAVGLPQLLDWVEQRL